MTEILALSDQRGHPRNVDVTHCAICSFTFMQSYDSGDARKRGIDSTRKVGASLFCWSPRQGADQEHGGASTHPRRLTAELAVSRAYKAVERSHAGDHGVP